MIDVNVEKKPIIVQNKYIQSSLRYREYLQKGLIHEKKTGSSTDTDRQAAVLIAEPATSSKDGSSACEPSFANPMNSKSGSKSAGKCSNASRLSSLERLNAAETFATYSLNSLPGSVVDVSSPNAPDTNMSVDNEFFSYKNKQKPRSKGTGAKGGTRGAGPF